MKSNNTPISLTVLITMSLLTAWASAQANDAESDSCTDDPEICEAVEMLMRSIDEAFEEHIIETRAREDRWLNTEMQIVIGAGKAVYDGFCIQCHGQYGMAEPPLHRSPLLEGDPQALIRAFTTGSHSRGAFASNYVDHQGHDWYWHDCHTIRASVATYLQTLSSSGGYVEKPVPLDASIRAKHDGERPDKNEMMWDMPQPLIGDFCNDV